MRILPILVAVAVLCSATAVQATSVKVDAQKEECFSEIMHPGSTMAISFIVTHGGKLDIDANLFLYQVDDDSLDDHPGNARYSSSADYIRHDRPVPVEVKTSRELLNSWRQVTEGTYDVRLKNPKEGGKHAHNAKATICFNNHMAKWTPKWVSFSFQKMDVSYATEGLNKDEMNFVHAIHREALSLHGVMTQTVKIRREEEQHRDFVESTNSWILWGTVINASMLIVMSFFQFWYLKRFLSIRNVVRM